MQPKGWIALMILAVLLTAMQQASTQAFARDPLDQEERLELVILILLNQG